MLGTIALDIDGTLTADSKEHTMPARVVEYLKGLASHGWRLVFITGRSYQAGFRILQALPFDYFLAVQNGAIILEMPSGRIISKKYLDRSIFAEMDAICRGLPSDFTVYGGYENRDEVYYRPSRFSKDMLAYLKDRIHGFQEIWHPLDSYDQLPIDAFPSVKCFGLYDSALEITQRIESRLGLHVPLIKDPFDERYYVVQATHPEITKGQALLSLLSALGRQGSIIAAGDDLNDLPMLAVADVKIAMSNSPKELLDVADIIARPASELGIIAAIEEAIRGYTLLDRLIHE